MTVGGADGPSSARVARKMEAGLGMRVEGGGGRWRRWKIQAEPHDLSCTDAGPRARLIGLFGNTNTSWLM